MSETPDGAVTERRWTGTAEGMAPGVGLEIRVNADGTPPHLLPRQE